MNKEGQFYYLDTKYGLEISRPVLTSTDCGIYVPLSDDKHLFVRDNSKKCTGNPRQNSV